MRRFGATLRRATPKGQSFITRTAPHQELYLHQALLAFRTHEITSVIEAGIVWLRTHGRGMFDCAFPLPSRQAGSRPGSCLCRVPPASLGNGRGLRLVAVVPVAIAITRTVNENTATVLPDDSWNR
jgi:hypothetical protein